MLSHGWKGALVGFAICLTLGCGDGPLADDSSASLRSQVRFALADAQTPLDVCVEADRITLDVSPEGVIEGGPSRSVFPNPCEATFTVTVKKNREVTFTGEVLGGEVTGQERLLLVGQASLPAAEAKDGFDVRIQLTDIDALSVQTETIGPGPANDYSFTVNGHPNTRIDIGHNDTVVVPAVAAGSRTVELDPTPCRIGDQMPNPRPVGVPVPSSDIGAVEFEVNCLSGVSVGWTGTCAGPLDLVVDGSPPIPIRSGEQILVGDLPAGTHTFELQNLPSNATVATIVGPHIQGGNPATVDLPVATSVDLTFVVTCAPVFLDAITVNVRELFGRPIRDRIDVWLDDALAKSVTSSSSTASVRLGALSAGNHKVELILTGGACSAIGTNPRQVPAPGTTTFDVECSP